MTPQVGNTFSRPLTGSLIATMLWLLYPAGPAPAQSVTVGSATGDPGTQVTVQVTLQTPGSPYDFAGVAGRIAYDPVNTPIAAAGDGTPDCTVSPFIQKVGSFAFWPAGCTGSGCQQLRAAVHYTSTQGTTTTIPNGALLFSCKVNIAAGAPGGTYPLIVSHTDGSTSASIKITTTGNDGQITVTGAGCS
jgi:hypothetical protein